jgi:hypothetical protein
MTNGNGGGLLLRGLDSLAAKILAGLHQLLGFQYSRNAEHYVFSATQITGTADVAGTTYNTAIRVTQEADFVCTRLNCGTRISSTTGAGNVIGLSAAAAAAGDFPDAPFSLLITDGSSDRQLSNEAVDAMLAYGTYGGLPGVWARPRIFPRNSTIQLRLTSFKAVPASVIWTHRLVFIGWKIYEAQALDNTRFSVPSR